MKPTNKNKKTKCCVSLSQGVQEENGLKKGKGCQGKKMKSYHNGLLMKTMKVLRCRKCICNCHRGGKCGCKGNEMKVKNNNNKEFIEKASDYNYSYNKNNSVCSEGSTLVLSHSRIMNNGYKQNGKHLMLVGRSYSINSKNNKDNHYSCDSICNDNNTNNSTTYTIIPYKRQIKHSYSMDNIKGVYNYNEYHNNSNTITVSDILKDPVSSQIINNNCNQSNGCNNNIIENQYEFSNSNNNNNLNEQPPHYTNEQSECIHPSVLRNHKKRILNRSISSYNDYINNSHTQSKKTFTFKPNDINNNNNMNHSLDIKNEGAYSNIQSLPIQQNEFVYNPHPNIPNSTSYTKTLNISQQPTSKQFPSNNTHKKLLHRSSSTHLLNNSSRYLNSYKDKLDLKSFEKQFHKLKLTSMQSKLKSLTNNISLNQTINNNHTNNNNNNNNSISKNNSTLSSSQTQLNNYITKQHRIKKSNQINLKRFNGMNNIFSKYMNTSSIMPANEYSSVIQAREYLFMND